MTTPLQARLCEDLLSLEALKADIRQTVGAPLHDGREPEDPLEALPAQYAALLRRAAGDRPCES